MYDKKDANKHQVNKDQTHMPLPPEGTSQAILLVYNIYIYIYIAHFIRVPPPPNPPSIPVVNALRFFRNYKKYICSPRRKCPLPTGQLFLSCGSVIIKKLLVAAEGGIIFVGRHEVRKLVLKIDYHVTEKTRGG